MHILSRAEPVRKRIERGDISMTDWTTADIPSLNGRTVVITCGLLEAEFGRDQIQAYGPDWRMPKSKGSMKAIIEPSSGRPEVS